MSRRKVASFGVYFSGLLEAHQDDAERAVDFNRCINIASSIGDDELKAYAARSLIKGLGAFPQGAVRTSARERIGQIVRTIGDASIKAQMIGRMQQTP